ncbi:type VII secretion-associated protein [Mycobacterium sp.]|uniref:type VII secretion-associated protein n=1 Tax=Mycobacterium sp. TaxID=1785 RepID=UPI003BA8C896
MSAHNVLIEAGPGVIRRLCSRAEAVADAEVSEGALGAIDDSAALVAERPVAIDSLWSSALRSVLCGTPDGLKTLVVVHPSWWPASRVGVVTAAARALSDDPHDVVARPRSWLLAQATPQTPAALTVVVEITERLVVVAGLDVVAVPRATEYRPVADEVALIVGKMVAGTAAVVLIDVPCGVADAPALATLIGDSVRKSGSCPTVVEIDGARLAQLARVAVSGLADSGESSSASTAVVRSRARAVASLGVAGVALAALTILVVGNHHQRFTDPAPTTFLVEGRIAMTVPSNWSTQRVVAGPGSARVQLTSPSDPEVALHLTQALVADETLARAAGRLKRAIAAQPPGVFVDFDPAGISAGRPAVTYREVRPGHQVRWTVLLDGAIQISIGCQSRAGIDDIVRDVCERAVRSAHVVR